MRHFLIVLFEKTKSILESDLTDANSRSERITKFREFMTTGQDIESAGQDRQYFYEGIADEVKTVRPICHLSFVFLHFTEDGERGGRKWGSCAVRVAQPPGLP